MCGSDPIRSSRAQGHAGDVTLSSPIESVNDLLDLTPARWIWLPAGRTLANTLALFRREVWLAARPRSARGWIVADSRYRLWVNGRRVGWGPAPCDPREQEADPLDLSDMLAAGSNVIAVEVLFYGHGDGTWPGLGKPGLLLSLDIDEASGARTRVVSDSTWSVRVDRAHRPGQYRRWYLRALQEVFDSRLRPAGWQAPGFVEDEAWMPAAESRGRADKPSGCQPEERYDGSDTFEVDACRLIPRSIPMLAEAECPAVRLAQASRVRWRQPVEEVFDLGLRDAFVIEPAPLPAAWVVAVPARGEGVAWTFEFDQQQVGWPYLELEAPAGTVVEMMAHEAHDLADPHALWLDTHFHAWSRLICRGGRERFETFDFECLRWLQVHIHAPDTGAAVTGEVRLHAVGLRTRRMPWPASPAIEVDEAPLQRLFAASLNTLDNSAQETVVDGMGRERQQYSGDCGHQLHVVRGLLGGDALAARYLRTFSSGQTPDGYFLDTWPAHDRLWRVAQRMVGATPWGPILDHSIGFGFDCWHHLLETGRHDDVRLPYQRLTRFAEYLDRLRGADGLLPVEALGLPAVWIDHEAYQQQRHKQCAFNLYAAAMLKHALAPLARELREPAQAARFEVLADSLLSATTSAFWDTERGLFVNNRRWLAQEPGPRLCDRSLATALLYDQCPDQAVAASVRVLAEMPPEVGLSYPANAIWRLWALARHGRIDVVLHDLRTRWAGMRSVLENNTLQEFWVASADGSAQWSHCPVAPLIILVHGLAGLRPLTPGYGRLALRPSLGDLAWLRFRLHTPRGPLDFQAERVGDGHQVRVRVPAACVVEAQIERGWVEVDRIH